MSVPYNAMEQETLKICLFNLKNSSQRPCIEMYSEMKLFQLKQLELSLKIVLGIADILCKFWYKVKMKV